MEAKNNTLYCGVVQHEFWLIFVRSEVFVTFLFIYAHTIIFIDYSSLNLVSLERTFYAYLEYVKNYPNGFMEAKNNTLYCGVVQHEFWLIFVRIEVFVTFLFIYAHTIIFIDYSSLNLVSLERTFYAYLEYVKNYPNGFMEAKNNTLYCGVVQHEFWLIFVRIEVFVTFLFIYAHTIIFID